MAHAAQNGQNTAVSQAKGKRKRSQQDVDVERYHSPPAKLNEVIARPTPICRAENAKTLPLLKVVEKSGDLFADTESTVLVHACNCKGKWGGGIALSFKKHFPRAFEAYEQHCKSNNEDMLVGTALLIAPEEGSIHKNANGKFISPPWIGCLFTSRSHGKNKDAETSILTNTYSSMEHLLSLIHSKTYYRSPTATTPQKGDPHNATAENHHPNLSNVELLAIRMCKINSGLFNVPWEKTKEILEGMEVKTGWFREVDVVSPAPKKKSRGGGNARPPRAKTVEGAQDGQDGIMQEAPPKQRRAPKRKALEAGEDESAPLCASQAEEADRR
ncbi:hypothetical protein DOTSEDRAFT_27104 [Dothistroma septosporum NZE10]|uniref:ADP-ribose 1''-phosphate phosphatase n=1 Tax=Dothistroma septosporum (strain NZE10 / CBS 128990) TaxID=675120 RepID=N1PGJ4_DOTSN|nr:hypothetical protein DOTSEDRAFT_27104 [Dothistroma septosporum NZE10]